MVATVRSPFRAIAIAVLGTCLVALLAAPRADAGYPGQLGVIAFDSDYSGLVNQEIQTMPFTGGPPFTRLTFDVLGMVENDDDPAYSGDGKRIVWEADQGDDEIFIMNADGSGQTQLTNNVGLDDQDPAISWDGKRVVFEGDDPLAPGDDEIFVMNSDGSGLTQLTFNAGAPGDSDQKPVFSRDGTKIYFQSNRTTGANEIWVMNANGSGQTQLTSSGAGNFSDDVDVSPDDRRLVFDSNRLGDDAIWVMNADGSGQTKLSSLPSGDNIDRPAFSPDGKRIVFEYQPGVGDDEIAAINAADGSGLAFLTTTDDVEDSPDWQPIPVSCGGRQATHVGTAGPDTIVGTAAADVIAGLQGKDKLSGLNGNDRLCGGKGKDVLKGGNGNDRLFGQAGKDKLKAGKGKKDTCAGGKGNDSGAGCEKEKSV